MKSPNWNYLVALKKVRRFCHIFVAFPENMNCCCVSVGVVKCSVCCTSVQGMLSWLLRHYCSFVWRFFLCQLCTQSAFVPNLSPWHFFIANAIIFGACLSWTTNCLLCPLASASSFSLFLKIQCDFVRFNSLSWFSWTTLNKSYVWFMSWFLSFGKRVECRNWCWMSNIYYCYLF